MFYYQTDALGSVTGLVNSSNQLVNRYQYTPWGEMETGESTYTTYDPLGFTARERDDETRLYYYRARYYDPQLGRFISEDPIGLAGGPNVYAYVGNNPINNTDPSGLEAECTDWYVVTIDFNTGRVVGERYVYTTCSPSAGGSSSSGAGSATRDVNKNKQCPVPPRLPRGASVDRNIKVANRMGWMTVLSWTQRWAWWITKVDYGAEWDYKNQSGAYDARYENGGNFNYGAAGRALGISGASLRRGAGLAQRLGPTGSAPDEGTPWGPAPHGDQRHDQDWINRGIRYYEEGCKQ